MDRYVTHIARLFVSARYGATDPYAISTLSQLAFRRTFAKLSDARHDSDLGRPQWLGRQDRDRTRDKRRLPLARARAGVQD
jgi:hypothetical protein